MSKVGLTDVRNTSPYHDYFQFMFEGADIVSAYWQPLFKGLGRGQLEMAHLGSKQGQAALQWSRSVAVAPTPAGLFAANVAFWQAMTDQFTESSRKMASVVTQAAQQPGPFEVLTLPVKRSRDTIVIPSDEDAGETPLPRKVA